MPISAKPKKHLDPKRPFNPTILRRAKEVAEEYKLVLWKEDGHWFGCAVEQPFAMGDGRTMAEAARRTRRSLQLSVATSLEKGESVPVPEIRQERRKRKAG